MLTDVTQSYNIASVSALHKVLTLQSAVHWLFTQLLSLYCFLDNKCTNCKQMATFNGCSADECQPVQNCILKFVNVIIFRDECK